VSHKTLYIDIDEEITSIVDRLRKAPANEVIVVVPKGSLLIQSLVNLKLLKKEANRRQKKLMIVTQDKIGKKLIEKAGILVQGEMKDSFDEGEIFENHPRKNKMEISKEASQDQDQNKEEEIVGSSEYFDEPLPQKEKSENIGKISFDKKKGERGSEFIAEETKKIEKELKPKGQKSKKRKSGETIGYRRGAEERKGKKAEARKAGSHKKKNDFSVEQLFSFAGNRETERVETRKIF